MPLLNRPIFWVASLLCASQAYAAGGVEVAYATRHDTSPPLRELLGRAPTQPSDNPGSNYEVPNIFPKLSGNFDPLDARALQAMQRAPIFIPAPSILTSFNGLSRAIGGGGVPPDTNGDVSPLHYIQWINTSWAIFDKATGNRISGPTVGRSFWAGFGGTCDTTNAGDPIALWDDVAERWVMSQFTTSAPFKQCFAVSATSDPLGAYHRYEFTWPVFGDYPHIGIWVDESSKQNAYLLTLHDFMPVPPNGALGFQGASFIAVERDKMLNGQPAAVIRFPGLTENYGALPAHLEGKVKAKAGSCPVFVHFDLNSNYSFFDMCLDWTTPANSTLVGPATVASRTSFLPFFNQIAQLGTTQLLDAFGGNLMYRASARAFSGASPYNMQLTVNHAVQVAPGQAGVKWVQFDLNQSEVLATQNAASLFGGSFESSVQSPKLTVRQLTNEGTFAPDANSRWMGGIAQDKNGNIGLGYSVSSSALSPELRTSGRTPNDPSGSMRDEQTCTPVGVGSQTGGSGRWGDYASMSVDSDDCTFWFTSEFTPVTSTSSWGTRICSFKFASCGVADWGISLETPARLEICTATSTTDPVVRLRGGIFSGFTGNVALSAVGAPAGVVPTFASNSIGLPGHSDVFLTGARTRAPGEYNLTLRGTSGAETRDVGVSFGVSAAASAAVVQQAPLNNAAGVKVNATLTWLASPGALRYRVEIARDSAFIQIVQTATVTGTSFAAQPLTASTEYFWRVRGINYCGDGAVSTVSRFVTGVPGTCPAGTTASVLFQDDFQSGVNNWTVSGSGGASWAQVVPAAATGITTTAWQIVNNEVTSDQVLSSPNLVIPANAARVLLSYDAYHSFETNDPDGCWDGVSLEAKPTGVAEVVLSGDRMYTDPYTGLISAGAPLAGRLAWCAQTTTPPRRSIVDFDGFTGQTVQLRFRASSDSNTVGVAPTGMAIDNLKVEICQ